MGKYVDNKIAFEDYSDMKQKLERDRRFVEQELARLTHQDTAEDLKIQPEDIMQDLKGNWLYLNSAERRQFLVKFLKRIVAVNEKAQGERFGVVRIVAAAFYKN